MSVDTPARPLPSASSSLYLLRDREQLFRQIKAGDQLAQTLRGALLTALAGSAIFGLALGSYAATWAQVAAATLKLPILLLGTAALCFPCFHIFQSWRAERPLPLAQALALKATALAAVALVWGSLAPPIIFLVASTHHYRLSQFLALGVGVLGGVVGLSVLMSGYRLLCRSEDSEEPSQRRDERAFLFIYFVIFGTVGSQLAWILRPFIGSPSLPFQLFRAPNPEDGNFFTFVLHMLGG